MRQGLVHLYWGEGKGKTTAAVGLAVRALGAGEQVTVVQFLKNGRSAELAALQKLGASVYAGKADTRFIVQMTQEEKAATKALQTQQLQEALAAPCNFLILDEACAVWQLDMVERALLKQAVLERPADREVVLTGRNPAEWMLAAADYSTEMRCHQHPYEKGIKARKGVEF
ncbi:MAG: cob(I)yrinic acid a,c-diamide adenosyltransferase [Ruthenibacterium sp.]